jgi:hypothetical protein
MWSLANEEPYKARSAGASIMQRHANLVHSLDSTRLCTAALNYGAAASVRFWM